ALLDRETEWIFNKTKTFGLPETEGTYLSMVISASHRYASTPKEALIAQVLEDVRACVPDARQANVVKSYVVKWPKATISPQPGVEALRPDQRSPLANLYVAGEWTQTGWPSTMEGAARTGSRLPSTCWHGRASSSASSFLTSNLPAWPASSAAAAAPVNQTAKA